MNINDFELMSRVVHNYIATTFSRRLSLFKPHKIITKNKLEFIVFDLGSCGKNITELLFVLFFDHLFNGDVYSLCTAVQPTRFRSSSYQREAEKMVKAALDEVINRLKSGVLVDIPYKKPAHY